jgi:CRISPR/Cas system-associated exonuclease Cas4 (RecB family)
MLITACLLSFKDDKDTDMSLSVSKTKTFEDCKAKFKFCYIEKLPRIDRDFHIFGKYLHQVLENFHRALIEDPSKREDWLPVMEAAWDAAYNEYSDQMTGLQYKEAREIVEEYKAILKEEGVPNVIAVEKPFYINLNNKVLLNGFIDRIQIDPDGMIHVGDYKTTKDKKYLKDFFQVMTYCYALCLEDPSIKRFRASFILLRHSFDYLTQEFTREEVISVAEKFLKAASEIEDEKLWRPNPQFLCKYCDYLDHCKSGKNYLIKKGVLEKKSPTVGIRKW